MSRTLVEDDFQDAAITLGVNAAVIKAVCEVEAPRGGFNPDGSPVTLFEGHKFFKYTQGAYATVSPDLCFPNWKDHPYGATWQAEQDRLKRAQLLDFKAACMSASWGKFQVMGFNYAACGYRDVSDFVEAMKRTEGDHLHAFIGYVQSNHLADELQRLDWAGFAAGYNGSGQVKAYSAKLAAAYAKFI